MTSAREKAPAAAVLKPKVHSTHQADFRLSFANDDARCEKRLRAGPQGLLSLLARAEVANDVRRDLGFGQHQIVEGCCGRCRPLCADREQLGRGEFTQHDRRVRRHKDLLAPVVGLRAQGIQKPHDAVRLKAKLDFVDDEDG